MSRSSIHFLCRRAPVARAAIVTAFFLAAAGLGWAQGGVSLPKEDVFSGGGYSPVYSDQFSTSCSKGNTSPYAGMDPLSCYGVMMPTDSTGRCTGARGWRLLRQVGNTCYFCQRINPPINGIVIPFDQLNQARAQGFECGVDQANPNCMAVCTRFAGTGPYIPPGTQSFSGSSPVQRGRPPLQGRVSTSGDPCLPFGPGGYDYCANPAGTQPRGCDCSKRWATAGGQEPGNGGPPDEPTEDDCLYPKCLYTTDCYRTRQVLHLNVDDLAQDRRSAYNCYMYARAFVTGAFPPTSENDYDSLSPRWLSEHGFTKRSSGTTLNGLAPAKVGDLVIVEDQTSYLGWSHVGVVIGVDVTNRITRIRQKIGFSPGPGQCVKDTTGDQFQTIEQLQGEEKYELWRNDSPGFFLERVVP